MSESPQTVSLEVGMADPAEPSVAALLRQSEEYAYSLYPSESVHMLPVNEIRMPHVRFIVARDNETRDALGCCAVVLQEHDCAEIKRMFVLSPATMRAAMRSGAVNVKRLRGVGTELMKMAEKVARAEGVRTLRFETGPEQPHAISLGHRFGYRLRGPYGNYSEDPNSVFMEKSLEIAEIRPLQFAVGRHT